MKVWGLAGLAVAALWAASCSAPSPTAVNAVAPAGSEVEAEAEPVAEGGAGGASAEESPVPGRLTGVPGIDRAQELELRILDARGTGSLGGEALSAGSGATLRTGAWLLSDDNSDYEITMRSALLPDGIVRLHGRSAFLVEEPVGPLPRFRVFAGQASFYLRNLPLGELTVLTPAGPLVTRGAVFSVTISPDFQVLVTCREGAVYLSGRQNAVAKPGQVLVADALGRGRAYSMTPNESSVFAERWKKIMTEEAAPLLKALLPRRLAAWHAAEALRDGETARYLALWFREARTVVGEVPGPDTWAQTLGTEVHSSRWKDTTIEPSLLGDLL